MTTRCKRGHPQTEANTVFFLRPDGKPFRVCKACRAQRWRDRYRADPAFREAKKAEALARYHARHA